MSQFAIVALFCEDVRVEQTGQETLVGVLPDNINVAAIPGIMPKLATYVRCNFSKDFSLKNLRIKMLSPNGDILFDNIVEQAIIQQAMQESRDNGSPIYSIKSFAIFSAFNIAAVGYYNVVSIVNDKEHVSGAIRFGLTP